MELYGSPTTKEIKKKHSSRPVGGVERNRGKAVADGPSKVADCGTGQARLQLADLVAPHSRIDTPEEWQGNDTDLATQGSSVGK